MASVEIKSNVAGKRMTPEEAGEAAVKLENTVLEGKDGKDTIGQVLPQIQAAQNATKEQIAATNAAQVDAAVAEQLQPINEAVDFLNLYNQRQAAELAREKEKEDKRIRWERLGHDIASIAASVGDMTRASEGAPVSPRDWQQTYDNLSAQARANIDNYRVRMAKLHEDEKNARMAQAQARAKAIGDRQKQDFDLKKLMLELGWKGDQASFERALKILLNDKDNATRENVAKNRANATGGGGKQKYISTMLGNTTFQFPDDKSFRNYILSVVEVLNKQDSYKDAKSGKTYSATLLKDQTLSNDPFGYYNKNVVGILRNHWSELTPQAQAEITNSILGHGGVQGNAPQGDGGWNGDEEYDD